MSLLAILDAIRASGEDQVREIENRALNQKRGILAGAKLEAERMEDEAYNAALVPAIRERARLLHHARFEALQMAGSVREMLVDAALEQTRGYLAGMREKSTYPSILLNLMQEALAELDVLLIGTEEVQLEADLRDRDILEDILSKASLRLQVEYNLDTWGGLIAKSLDGRIVVINTFEARLERATQYLRSYLAVLFESENVDQVRRQVFNEAATR